jgi:hypothetical protein
MLGSSLLGKEERQMAEEKDRLGNKLRDAEKGREDDYFARRDRELLAKLRKGGAEGETSESEDEKKRGR